MVLFKSDFSILFSAILFNACKISAEKTTLERSIYQRDTTLDDVLPRAVAQWFPAGSVLQCGRLCQAQTWCNSFFYHHTNTACAPQRTVYRALFSNQTGSAPGWSYYQITSASCPAKGGYVIDRLTATCYRIVTSPPLTWLEARAACDSSNEMLAVLEPVDKAQFLFEFLTTNLGLHNFSQFFFIGACRPEAAWNTPVPSTGLELFWVKDGRPLDVKAALSILANSFYAKKDFKNCACLKTNKKRFFAVCKDSIDRFYICERPYY